MDDGDGEANTNRDWNMSIRDKIVADWTSAWRWVSVQAMTFNAALMSTWLVLPDEFKASLNPSWIKAAAIASSVIGIGGRLYKQSPTQVGPKTE